MVEFDGAANPDIVIVASFPMPVDIKSGPFMSSGGAIVVSILNKLRKLLDMSEEVSVAWAYAVRCSGEALDYKIKVDTYEQCAPHLMTHLDRWRPKIIIALGREVIKALGMRQKLSDVRGNYYSKSYGSWSTMILPTFHPANIMTQPGLTPIFKKDIRKAITYVNNRVVEQQFEILLPLTCEEVLRDLTICEEYINTYYETYGKLLPVAIDTETTSLNAWDPTTRMIMVSISWANNVGLAFPWKHRDAPYTDTEYELIKAKFQKIFTTLKNTAAKMRIAMHNAKFDEKWLLLKYELGIDEAEYDTMLVEHLIDEDKKGENSLKVLLKDYYPGFGKYEEELQNILSDLKQQRAAGYKAAVREYKASLRNKYLNYWIALTTPERIRLLSTWVNKGFIQIKEIQEIDTPVTRKFKGTVGITKKWKAAAYKLLKWIPAEEFEGAIDLREPDPPVEVTFEDIPIDILGKYATIDAIGTRKLIPQQLKAIASEDKYVDLINQKRGTKHQLDILPVLHPLKRLVMPLSRALSRMEYGGVRVNRDRIREYEILLEKKIKIAEDILYTDVGKKINLDGDDLPVYLYSTLGYPVRYKTESGLPSVAADAIKDLADEYDTPFLNNLLHYRKMGKAKNTYLKNWLAMSAVDGKIHCSLNINGTATYRLSSSNPNLQNISYILKLPVINEGDIPYINLKAVFIPDSDEYELYDLDISNAEMRALTAYSHDAELIRVFNEGLDMHCLTGSAIGGVPYEDMVKNKEEKSTKEYVFRQLAKKVNFGTIYCIGAKGLQAQLWGDLRLARTEQECTEYLAAFFKKFPDVARYISTTQQFAKANKFVYTLTGRRRRFPLLHHSTVNNWRVNKQSVNGRIQTSSSDLVNNNIVDMDKYVRANEGRMFFPVHDSMVFQLPKGIGNVRKDFDKIIIDGTAEAYPWLPVAWAYDVGKGPNYGEANLKVA